MIASDRSRARAAYLLDKLDQRWQEKIKRKQRERERESLSSLAGGDPGQAEPSREGEWRREGSLATSLFNSFFINQLINLTNSSSWIDEWRGRAHRLLPMIQLTSETQPVEAQEPSGDLPIILDRGIFCGILASTYYTKSTDYNTFVTDCTWKHQDLNRLCLKTNLPGHCYGSWFSFLNLALPSEWSVCVSTKLVIPIRATSHTGNCESPKESVQRPSQCTSNIM